MQSIKQFNKTKIIQLRSSIDEALDRVAKEYGITISAGNCSFSGNEANFKLKLNTIGEGGTVITVVDFIDRMDEVSTDSILSDPAIVDMINGGVPQQIANVDNPLGTMELFLQLFIDREEYEVCAKLVEVHPELKQY